MSVLVAKRTQSHVEYVTATYNLFELVLKQAKKLPKTVTFYLVQPWINHSRNAYVNTFKANNIYLNKENLDIRTNLNKQALEVNIKKTKIVKLSTNIIFLKEHYLKTNTKVYVKPNMQNIKKFLKKYKQHILTKADLVAWYGSFKKYKGAYVMNTLEKLISVEVLNLWQKNI